MKPDFVSQSLWDALPDDWREELLLESGRRFRRGALREAAFTGACDSVLVDEVWRFFGVDDFEPPVIWPMLVDGDQTRRHPALLRGIHLLGLSRTAPLVITKLRDDPERVFYLADARPPEGDCPHCGLVLRPGEDGGHVEEPVHADCAEDYAAVREEMGRRLIEASLEAVGDAELEQNAEDDEVLEDATEFLAMFSEDAVSDRL